MKSKRIRSGILVCLAFAILIVLVGCDDNPTKTVSDKEKPPQGFLAIQVDTFTMGSPASEIDRESDEILHKVTLTTYYYMFATEVTNQQYAEMAQWAYENDYCTATNTSLFDNIDGSVIELLNFDDPYCEISFNDSSFAVDSSKGDHPVNLSWFGAATYCDWLSMQAGLTKAYDHSSWECNGNDPYNAEGYRLPTEAEWEYACRAGTQTPFNTGNCLDAATEANYNGANPYDECPIGPYEMGTLPVASYQANAFDLYDMHGNVWEWCNDWSGSYSDDVIDPVGSASGSYKIYRGGYWRKDAHYCRSANRCYFEGGSQGRAPDIIGFRPVRSIN